ncbi:prepilin-type N-terminal cleavage/methylation domain-containing protein [Patescibacteria group bacterium]|nr:prepilin-type N-terminal cleavage/methylation domain-containing protein [Patescibacteria group bacterium]MBU1922250.1 prepilin-type N-terminal cleavage/methylation domain-containing protein [Patescibacteria group bacterium]
MAINKKNQKGFTLIEMLVVLAVFSTFLIVAMDLFLTINRVQRRTEVSERVLSENRFIMETMAQLARTGRIDYEAYPDPTNPIANPTDELIVRQGDEQVRLKQQTSFCPSSQSAPCATISRDGGATWASITPRGMRVTNLKFIVTPQLNPFYFDGVDYLAQDQPQVTIIFGLASTREISGQDIEVNNQTTISMREYVR